MNARMYDPIQARMLSPDNFVSNTLHTQGYNRYSYANNNPLKYTDPDGNFPFAIIGAAVLIGGFFKGIEYAERGKSFLGGFWRGALVSGIGAATGAGIANSFSNFGMVGAGALNGATTGTISGALGSILDGNNSLTGAWKGGLMGALSGAMTGLINRLAIKAEAYKMSNECYTSTGEKYIVESQLEELYTQKGGNLSLAKQEFNVADLRLANYNDLPKGFNYTVDDLMHDITDPPGVRTLGVTVPKGGYFNQLKSKIWIAPGLKGAAWGGINQTHMVINHELMHAYHWKIAPKARFNRYTERAASAYNYDYKTFHFRPNCGLPPLDLRFPHNFSWQHMEKQFSFMRFF